MINSKFELPFHSSWMDAMLFPWITPRPKWIRGNNDLSSFWWIRLKMRMLKIKLRSTGTFRSLHGVLLCLSDVTELISLLHFQKEIFSMCTKISSWLERDSPCLKIYFKSCNYMFHPSKKYLITHRKLLPKEKEKKTVCQSWFQKSMTRNGKNA